MNKKEKKYVATILLEHCSYHTQLRIDKDNAFLKKDWYNYNRIKKILEDENKNNQGCPDCSYCSYSVDDILRFHKFVTSKHPNFKYYAIFKKLPEHLAKSKKTADRKGQFLDWFSKRKIPNSKFI